MLAGEIHPELLLIDVDPPWPKLTQLLGKMREAHPETRVLIIGATIPKALIEHRGTQHALQFLEKPFDVAELGAAVQALLGPWKESETEHLRGTLRSFGAIDAALLQCAGGRTVVLEIKKNGSKSGELHFVDGQLIHAENGKRTGPDALEELFNWPQPEMREKEKRARVVAKRTIPVPWTDSFLAALQKVKVQSPPAVAAPPAPLIVARPVPKTGKKIVLVDDTEMLLIFVEDVLTMADSTLQITTAASGLAGVKEIERVLPDLALLDYSLPDVNGDEVCQRLLESERTADIPILMMSGHAPEMARAASRMENVVATIEKPFLSEALVAIVQRTLKAGPELRRQKSLAAKEVASPKVQALAKVQQPVSKAEPPKPVVPTEAPRSQRTATVPKPIPPTPKPAAQPKIKKEVAPDVEAAVVKPPVEVAPVAPPLPAPVPPPPPVVPPPAPVRQSPPVPLEHPIPHVITVPFPVQQIPKPGIAVSVPARAERAAGLGSTLIAAPVLATGVNDVVLGLFLEVVSMQLTPALRMGTIQARPSSLTVSLHVASPALRAALPPNGFQLGPVDLDRFGRIAALRLTPTVQPFTPLQTRSALQIGNVSVVPSNSHNRLQLTPSVNAPMRMHLLAKFEVAGVELSSSFQISQLILKSQTSNVRMTLNEQAVDQENIGTVCEITAVQIDAEARLSEVTLNPGA